MKCLDIHYCLSDLPGLEPDDLGAALAFGDMATAVLAAAMSAHDAGSWLGADIGQNAETGAIEITIRCAVYDHRYGDAVVRAALVDTPCAAFRKIVWQREMDAQAA